MEEWAVGELGVDVVKGRVGAGGIDLFLPEFGVYCIAV